MNEWMNGNKKEWMKEKKCLILELLKITSNQFNKFVHQELDMKENKLDISEDTGAKFILF